MPVVSVCLLKAEVKLTQAQMGWQVFGVFGIVKVLTILLKKYYGFKTNKKRKR